MNGTRVKCFLAMMVLALIGFGPLSLTCLIGLFVVAFRPRWFFEVVEKLYRNNSSQPIDPLPETLSNNRKARNARIKCFLNLIVLLILDIAPLPVTGSIGLYVIAARPRWFKALVRKIYTGH